MTIFSNTIAPEPDNLSPTKKISSETSAKWWNPMSNLSTEARRIGWYAPQGTEKSTRSSHFAEVSSMSSYDLRILNGWKHYLEYQSKDIHTEVPHLASKLRFYTERSIPPKSAWSDFQKILELHGDAIQWEWGKKGFEIPDFHARNCPYEIFLELLAEAGKSRDRVDWIIENTKGKALEIQGSPIFASETIRLFFFEFAGVGLRDASYEKLMGLNEREIRDLEFEWMRIGALATRTGWHLSRKEANVLSPGVFRIFVSWLFGKEYRKFDRSVAEAYFFNFAGHGKKEASYRRLMELSQGEIIALKIRNESIVSIAKLCGYSHPKGSRVQGPKAFRAFIGWLFAREHRELDAEMVRSYFFDYSVHGGMEELHDFNRVSTKNREASYAMLKSMNIARIEAIKIRGHGMIHIAGVSGWGDPDRRNVRHPVKFREFMDWLFERS